MLRNASNNTVAVIFAAAVIVVSYDLYLLTKLVG